MDDMDHFQSSSTCTSRHGHVTKELVPPHVTDLSRAARKESSNKHTHVPLSQSVLGSIPSGETEEL